MNKPYVPALVLLLVAPALPELLTGSTPPLRFIHPLALVTLVALYGGGAVLIREMLVRWKKGWPSLLALGAAYGILEEGLLCKSFFDPQWPDLGVLATYGRWLGVNWVWSLGLTVFHGLYSIGLTILVVELLFPAQRGRPWLRSWALLLLFDLLALDVLVGLKFFGGTIERGGQPFVPPPVPYLVALAMVAGLVYLGWRLPKPAPPAGAEAPRGARPLWFFAVGFLGTVSFFLISWALPNLNVGGMVPHPIVALAVTAACTCGGVWLVWRMSGRGAAWNDSRAVALVAGSVGVLALFALLLGSKNEGLKDRSGMWIVAVVVAVLLALLMWRVRRRRTALANPPAPG